MKNAANAKKTARTRVFAKTYAPGPNLTGLAHYWRLTSKGKKVDRDLSFLPDENMEIFFDFHPASGRKTPMLLGLLAAEAPLKGGREMDIIGIKLYPGTFHFLFRLPASRFVNKTMPLEAAIGMQALPFEKVFSQKNIKQRIRLIDSLLAEIATWRKPLDPKIKLALDCISHSESAPSVEELVKATGRSRTWLDEMFKKWVGLPPKPFCNNLKFKKAQRLLATKKSQTDTAYEAGYADQPHLIRAFKKCTGCTPAKIFAEESWRPKKVFLLDNSKPRR